MSGRVLLALAAGPDRRSHVRPGMAEPGNALVRAFTTVGSGWGGRWPLPTDFQHFSVNGR